MSSFTDGILRFLGYMIVFVLIAIVCLVIYVIYSLNNFSEQQHIIKQEEDSINIEQDLQNELNKNQPLNNDSVISNDNSNNNTYQAPETQVPDYSTYNPFEDDNRPLTDPDQVKPMSTIGTINSSQPDTTINSNNKPIDPTTKNQKPDLDLLF